MTDTTSVAHAARAAEAVRALNHATLQPGALEDPSQVSSIVIDLLTAVQRIPQALTQIQEWLYLEAEAGRVRDDRGGRGGGIPALTPLGTVEAVAAQLTEASVHLRRYSLAMQIAAAHLSHLAGR